MPMKHITLFIAIGIAANGNAQLLNGSFENALGQGDLSNWDHACIAQSSAGGAPLSGNWNAEVEASNPQGCPGSWLYQVVPTAYDGMTFFLGGWCRNVDGPWMPPIGLDIGAMTTGGVITPLNIGPTITDTAWTWIAVYDTIHLAPNEQAVVICHPGLVGGPAFALAQFDGLQFFETTFPFGVEDAPVLTNYHDVANGDLHIASNHARILDVRLVDPIGRSLPTNTEIVNATTRRVHLTTLPAGVYFAVVRTDRGEQAVRFLVE